MPKLTRDQDGFITCRIPVLLVEALLRQAEKQNTTKSTIIRKALESYLDEARLGTTR